MKVLLFNDTATQSHIGCQAVSDAHTRLLARRGYKVWKRYFVKELQHFAKPTLTATSQALRRSEELIADIRNSDVLIVNGEGTIHHGKGIEYVALIEIARENRRPIFFVNCLLQDLKFDTDLLKQAEHIVVRDPNSFEYGRQMGIDCTLVPDSIMEAEFNNTVTPNLADKAVVTDWIRQQDPVAGKLSAQILFASDAPYHVFFPLHSLEARHSWKFAKIIVAHASVLVSSRHHAIYLALMSGTPFVPLTSNSWKIQALLELAGLKSFAISTPADLREAMTAVQRNRGQFISAQNRLAEYLPLQTFGRLGPLQHSLDEASELALLSEQVQQKKTMIMEDKVSIARKRLRESIMFQVAALDSQRPGHGIRPAVRKLHLKSLQLLV